MTVGRGSRRQGAPASPQTRPDAPADAEPAPAVDADAAVAVDADAPEPADPPAASGRRGLRLPEGRPSWAVVGAASALAVVCLGAVLGLALTRPPAEGELRESALVAARTYTTSLTTYDHRTLDEDIERVQRVAVGQFADEYNQTIEALRAQLVSTQATSSGTVVGAGIESLDDGSATVLVAVDQAITTVGAPQPRSESNRLRMVLQRSEGSWRVSQVQRL